MPQAYGLSNKVCIITGGTGGIGRVTARRLAAQGAAVTVVGRSRGEGAAVVAEIERSGGGGTAAFIAADLSSQADRTRLAGVLLERHPRIDVLVNNVGGMFGTRRLSADGLEMTFALNHMGYFHLTGLLLPALKAAAPSRIVNVASDAHVGAELDFADLQSEHGYKGFQAYKRSKLANVYFTYELARRLDGSDVTVNALHPGFVATGIGTRNGWTSRLAWSLLKVAAIGVEAGAKTSIYLAGAPEIEGISGLYFHKCHPKPSSRVSYGEDAQRRLWTLSAGLCGLDPAASTSRE